MDLTDPIHRKVIGICFIVFSILGIMGLLFYDFFMDFAFGFIEEAAIDDPPPFDLFGLLGFIRSFIWAIGILFFVPRIIIGFGLINRQKWADIPALVFAVIGLINIPIGSLLGVYAILVFTAKPKVQGEQPEIRDN
jgi:hypothetical protein